MKNIFLASLIAICGSASAQEFDCNACANNGCPMPECVNCPCAGTDTASQKACDAWNQNCYDQKANAERQLNKTQTTTIESTATEQVEN